MVAGMVAWAKWAGECLAHMGFWVICFGLFNTVRYWTPEIKSVLLEVAFRLLT